MGQLELQFFRKMVRLLKGILSAFESYLDEKEQQLNADK